MKEKSGNSAWLTGIGKIPDSVWGMITAGPLILIIGFTGWAVGFPWLFASLGPTILIHVDKVNDNSSRFYNVVVGHLIALGSGFLAVAIVNVWSDPQVSGDTVLTVGRIVAAFLGILVLIPTQFVVRAAHAPAAATVLLITLGNYQSLRAALALFVGIMLVGILGEILRQIRLRAKQRAQSNQSASRA